MIHASSCILDINVTYSIFSTPFKVLKNIIFLLVVLFLLSCQTYQFLLKYFFKWRLFIIVVRKECPWVCCLLKTRTYGRTSRTFEPTVTWCCNSNRIVPGISIKDGTV